MYGSKHNQLDNQTPYRDRPCDLTLCSNPSLTGLQNPITKRHVLTSPLGQTRCTIPTPIPNHVQSLATIVIAGT